MMFATSHHRTKTLTPLAHTMRVMKGPYDSSTSSEQVVISNGNRSSNMYQQNVLTFEDSQFLFSLLHRFVDGAVCLYIDASYSICRHLITIEELVKAHITYHYF